MNFSAQFCVEFLLICKIKEREFQNYLCHSVPYFYTYPGFIVENSKELSNPKDAMVMPSGTTKEQCRRICRDDKGLLPFVCKSFHYSNELSQLCLLSEHNSFDIKNSSTTTIESSLFTYSEATCIQGGNPESRQTKDNNNDVDVMAVSQNLDTSSSEPFRLLRNTILEAEPYAVYQGYVLGRCLDECLYRDSDL